MRRKRRTVRRFTSSIQNRRRRLRYRRRFRRADCTARLIELGRRPYREVLELQREIHARVARGEDQDTWLLVEHDPVITLGRNAKGDNVLLGARVLAAHGIEVISIERGGDATYHGAGQLVVYPIVKLARFREIVPLISALERAVIDALAIFGITAGTRQEHRGVYVGDTAICAIGLAVKQMTSLHGLALNVSIALDYDKFIIPCGTPNLGITSISRELGRIVTLEEGRNALVAALEGTFSMRLEPCSDPYRQAS